MRWIIKSSQRLTVVNLRWGNQVHWLQWIASTLSVLIGSIVLSWQPMVSQGFIRCEGPFCERQDPWSLDSPPSLIPPLIGLGLMVIGILFLLLAKTEICVLDKVSDQVVLNRNGMLRKPTMTRLLSEVKAMQLITVPDRWSQDAYKAIMVFWPTPPKYVALTQNINYNLEEENTLVLEIRAFLGLVEKRKELRTIPDQELA